MGIREIQQGPPPMAYLSQAGQGLGQLAQVAERNRQIDPAKLHRLISRVMNGEDPVDVARQHKIEEHLASNGQGSGMGAPSSPQHSPQGAPPPVIAGGGAGVNSGAEGNEPYPTRPRMPNGPVASQPVTGGAPFLSRAGGDETYSAEDLGDAKEFVGPMYHAQVSAANRTSREGVETMKEGGRNARKEETLASTNTNKDADRAQKAQFHSDAQDAAGKKLTEDWNKALLRARTSVENARQGRAKAEDIGAMKAFLSYSAAISGQQSALAGKTNEFGGALGTSKELSDQLEKLKAQHDAMAPQVKAALDLAEQKMKEKSTPATSEKTKVSMPGEVPDTSGMDMVPVISPAGVRGKLPRGSIDEAVRLHGYKLAR